MEKCHGNGKAHPGKAIKSGVEHFSSGLSMFFVFQATKEKNKKDIEAMQNLYQQQQQMWGDKAQTDKTSKTLRTEIPKKTGGTVQDAKKDVSPTNSFIGQQRSEPQKQEQKTQQSEFSGANYFVGRQQQVNSSKLEATTIWSVAGDALGKMGDWAKRQYNSAKDWVSNLFE